MAEIGAIAGVIFAYGIVSRTLGRYNVSAPMVFAALGIICGPSLLGIADYKLTGHSGLVIAEIALVVVLFSDASRSDLGELRNDGSWAGRLLVIGMPLTIMAGTATAVVLVSGIQFWEAAVIAAVLAPTDAALGHAVVSSPKVPARIRQTINVEAGLNDGLSIPFLFLFLGLAVDQASLDATAWFTFGVQQVALGAVVGIVAGGGGGWLGAARGQTPHDHLLVRAHGDGRDRGRFLGPGRPARRKRLHRGLRRGTGGIAVCP